MRRLGPGNLSDAELLQALLVSGTQGRPVKQIVRQLLSQGKLNELPGWSWQRLESVAGLGPAKTTLLLAAMEVGRRCFAPPPTLVLHQPADVFAACQSIRTKHREYVLGFYLNARHQVLKQETISIGGVHSSSFQPRDVFAPALQLPCAAVIVAHNHPSGDPQPSPADLQVTKTLQAAGELLGVCLLDHLIVTEQEYCSAGQRWEG